MSDYIFAFCRPVCMLINVLSLKCRESLSSSISLIITDVCIH